MPQKHPGGLGSWVARQRCDGKKGSQGCDTEQAQKLDELGFRWGLARILSDRWEARFQQLKEFKKEHGHCDVPKKHPGGLGSWAALQRCEARSQHRDAEQAQKLEELGFQWSKQYPWEARFEQLKEFKEEHGHCNVPQRQPGGLGFWVKYQRSRQGSRSRNVSQTQKLDELGLKLQEDFKDDGLSKAVVRTRVAAAVEDNAVSTKPSSPMIQGGNEQGSCGTRMAKQTRQQMQAAAARGDDILADKLQDILTLRQEMQQAAQQNDFILARHLQTQLNACFEPVAK